MLELEEQVHLCHADSYRSCCVKSWILLSSLQNTNLCKSILYSLLCSAVRVSWSSCNTSVRTTALIVWAYFSSLVVDPWSCQRSAPIMQMVLSHSFHISSLSILDEIQPSPEGCGERRPPPEFSSSYTGQGFSAGLLSHSAFYPQLTETFI